MPNEELSPPPDSSPPDAMQWYVRRIRFYWRLFKRWERHSHASLLRRYPIPVRFTEWFLEWLYQIIASPASAVILALLLGALVVSEVVTVIVSLCVFGAWLVFIVAVARTEIVKQLPILRRFVLIFAFACIAALISHLYVGWVLSSYAKHHHEPQQQKESATTSKDTVDEQLVTRLRQLFSEQVSAITRTIPKQVPQIKPEETVPENFRIKDNRFSEMPTPELIKTANSLAENMRNDQDSTNQAWKDAWHAYLNRSHAAKTDSERQDADTYWQITQAAINGDLLGRYAFNYYPDAILLFRAMERRAPAGAVDPYKIQEYERRRNNTNVSDIPELADDLERLAKSIKLGIPQFRPDKAAEP